MPSNAPRLFFHPVMINDYGLFKYPDYTLPLSVKMAEVSRAHQLDVLHVHYAVPHATAAVLARAMLAPGAGPRVVTTLHGTDTTLLGADPGYGPAIHHALTHSDAVTTVSHYLKAETERVLGFTGPMDVIHNFFEPRPARRSRAEVRRELGLGDDVLLVHSSNLRPVKRIDLLLDAVARVKARAPFKLLILAGGSFAPFAETARRLKVEEQLIVRENVLDVEDYLQAADAGFYTSESESFCLSILEAMCFACPSVATQVGGVPEVIQHNESGVLVPFGDAAALARALENLIDSPASRRSLGEAARARARKLFCADVIVPQYEALYRRVCA